MIEAPAEATVVGSSPFCRYAALAYDDKAYSIQPHPEFRADFMADLIPARREILPDDIAESAKNSLDQNTSSMEIASQIADFFKRDR